MPDNPNEGLPKQCILLHADGADIVTITRSTRMPLEKALSSLVKDTPKVITNVATLHDRPVHLAMGTATAVMTTELKTLGLSTILTMKPASGRGDTAVPRHITPCYVPGSSTLNLQLKWKIPDSMRLWFTIHWQVLSSGYAYNYCSLCVTHRPPVPSGMAGLFYLPMPNTYADAKICMGGSAGQPSLNDPAASLLDHFARAYAQFETNAWNADLLTGENLARSEKLFRFGVDAPHETLATGAPWPTLCHRTANTQLDMIPFEKL